MRKLLFIAMTIAACWFAASRANAAELRVPEHAVAGQDLQIATTGSGQGTLLLVGPGEVIKHTVRLGENAEIKGEELKHAGRWIAILRAGSPQSQVFWVEPGKTESLSFLARPSRVPVNRPNVISGVVFTFDKYQNLVVQPAEVAFTLSVGGTSASQKVATKDGVAWVRSSSAKKAGAAQFVAKVGDVAVNRVVQQVASEPCENSLRMHVAGRKDGRLILQTDPIHDCTGNPVPDGTIVTFIETDSSGRSVVDARIKKGIATAELPASAKAHVSVASGVVLGNELNVGGGE
jgi:hypothetical protein